MFERKIASALLLIAASAAAPAAAQPVIVEGDPPARMIRVGYDDLNLATSGGRAALDARVRSAARQLCIDHGVADIWHKMEGRKCLGQELAEPRPQIRQAVADFNAVRLARRGGAIEVAVRR